MIYSITIKCLIIKNKEGRHCIPSHVCLFLFRKEKLCYTSNQKKEIIFSNK